MKLAAGLLLVLVPAAARADVPKPDPLADERAREANLEPTGPRAGITFSGAIGAGLILSHGKSDRVGALDLRLGHVASENIVVNVELVGGTYVHSQAGQTLFDSEGGTLVGAQYYIAPSVWIRGGVGIGLHTTDDGTSMGKQTHAGLAGIGGAGIDVLRRHYFVVGLEGFFLAQLGGGGLSSLGSLGFGVSYY